MSGPQATRLDMKRLVLGSAAVAAIWGVLLPALLRCPAIARHVARMEERGVNPAAMYYTELDRLPLRPDWVDRRLTLWP
ncbi:MAG: hypothetical protein WCC69_08565 [Pirellulales bacterium]